MRELCATHDLVGINKGPLNKGVLTGKYSPKSTFPEDDIRSHANFEDEHFLRRLKTVDALREILTSGGRSMAQGALAYIWALDERMVPIPGFRTVDQVVDNAGALNYGPLTQEELGQAREIVAENEPQD